MDSNKGKTNAIGNVVQMDVKHLPQGQKWVAFPRGLYQGYDTSGGNQAFYVDQWSKHIEVIREDHPSSWV